MKRIANGDTDSRFPVSAVKVVDCKGICYVISSNRPSISVTVFQSVKLFTFYKV